MKIGVVGLGLIGGSIFKALNDSYDVVGISCSQNNKLKNIVNDLNLLKDCDVVFVATPMNKTLDVLDKLDKVLNKDTIVADVCSLKEFLSKKEYRFNFIPTHPMAGTEKKGFENSFKELFEGAKWVICKKEIECPKKLKILIEQMGAKIVYTSPKEHDEAVAIISHAPMVLSQALFKLAEQNELALKLASSGFRDMTRLAITNDEMASDMVNMNYQNIQNAILKFYTSVGDLLKSDYRQQVSVIRESRSKMYDKNGKNVLEH